MNNKGQSLVTFILLLPIIFLLIAVTTDLGYLELDKQKYQNEIKSTIKYGLNHIDDENIKAKMENLLQTNGTKEIEVNDKTIRITIKDKHKSIFNNIFKNEYDINITYNGYIENNKKIITKG